MLSNAEKEYGDVLDLLVLADPQQILSHSHHPPAARLPGNTQWAIDYLAVAVDGTEFYVEVKAGLMDQHYKLKLELYRQCQESHSLLPLFVVVRYAEMRFRVIDEIGTEGLEQPLL